MTANAVVHRGPALAHPCLVFVGKEAERSVPEDDQGPTIHFTQPVLDIGDERKRGEQLTNEFKQRWPHGGFHVGLEMPIAFAHVAVTIFLRATVRSSC